MSQKFIQYQVGTAFDSLGIRLVSDFVKMDFIFRKMNH